LIILETIRGLGRRLIRVQKFRGSLMKCVWNLVSHMCMLLSNPKNGLNGLQEKESSRVPFGQMENSEMRDILRLMD